MYALSLGLILRDPILIRVIQFVGLSSFAASFKWYAIKALSTDLQITEHIPEAN